MLFCCAFACLRIPVAPHENGSPAVPGRFPGRWKKAKNRISLNLPAGEPLFKIGDMTLFEQLNRIRRLDSLIRRKATGKPEELAERIDVSRATVFRYIDELRAFGAPIVYDKDRQSYCYEDPFELKI